VGGLGAGPCAGMIGWVGLGKGTVAYIHLDSALHPSGVAFFNEVPASFGWDKRGNVTSAGWQVTPCDPVWHVSSRSGEAS